MYNISFFTHDKSGGRKMKKILIALLCVSFLTACGNKDDANTNNNTTDNNTTNADENLPGSNQIATSGWYQSFEDELKKQNITYSTKTATDAASIGGVEGYRYETGNGNIDVYRFEDGDQFDEIVKNKKINIDGTDKNVEVNGHMVIVSDDLSSNILDIFRGLK